MTFYGGWLVVLVLAAILGFYSCKGPVKLHEPPDRAPDAALQHLEQAVHWIDRRSASASSACRA